MMLQTVRTATAAATAAALALGLATPAWAQAQAQAPAASAAPGLGGPVVPGVCFLSREAVLANSKVAVYASERVRQIAAEAQAEVDRQRKPLDDELTALRAQSAKLPPDQLRAQQKALADRYAPVQALVEQRKREVEKTRVDAVAAVSAQAQPMIAAAYAQKGCGVLFDRNTVLGGNLANDLTAAVVAALDAKVTQIPIQRATVPAAPAAAPAR